jgi:hypothetical protein
MNADEQEIYDFLNENPETFVSATEVSKKLGKGRRSNKDKMWARPILRRMEMDGVLETNECGEYRIAVKEVPFKEALKTPGVSLGDTTIIRLEDVHSGGARVSK